MENINFYTTLVYKFSIVHRKASRFDTGVDGHIGVYCLRDADRS